MQLSMDKVGGLDKKVLIAAGALFDPYAKALVRDQLITVNATSGLVEDVTSVENGEWGMDFEAADIAVQLIDLRKLTVLPGLVDAHVHFFLHAYSETSWDDQLLHESLVERTVRAVAHARRTLMAGYTAVRDLGTEGAGDADVHLRKCISGPNALSPGPRYFCANRALVCTGSYGPKSRIHPTQDGVEGITGAEIADGKDECIKAVRRQIGAGADWIKVYADYRFRSRLADVAPGIAAASQSTFSLDELNAIVDTAHACGVKVAAHASTAKAVENAILAGVDSIEHGHQMDVESAVQCVPVKDMTAGVVLEKTHVTWVPTLAVYHTLGKKNGVWEQARETFRKALMQKTIPIACGGDTGAFSHGSNALEMQLMVQLGAPWRDVLKWATLGGWELLRSMRWEDAARLGAIAECKEDARVVGDNEVPFGAVRRGYAADIVATSGDLEGDFERAVSAESIAFVMKGGRVYKKDFVEVA